MSTLQPADPLLMASNTEVASLADILDDVGDEISIVATGQVWDQLPDRNRSDEVFRASSLESIALDRAVNVVAGSGRSGPVVGVGGGTAIDTAKFVATVLGRQAIIVPASTATLAPFVRAVAQRHRRELRLSDAQPAHRIVLDSELLGRTTPAINRLGAAELIATLVALIDWEHASSSVTPFSEIVAEMARDLVTRLSALAPDIGVLSEAGSSRTDASSGNQTVLALAALLSEAGAIIDHVGHRRMFEGSEHLFVEAAEHRLGGDAQRHGQLVALGTIVMAELQEADVEWCEALLNGCGIAAHPVTLGLDEDVFNGLLRHTVRFAIGEQRPETILNQRQIDRPTAAAMWRRAWNLAR